MNPEEYADKLVEEMCNIEQGFGSVGYWEGIQCALIAVDKLLYVLDHLRLHEDDEHWFGYFVKVREELEKKRP